MKTDTLPAFALEKDAVMTDIENGLADGVKRLAQDGVQNREDHFHNTRYLLRQYRRVEYAIRISEADLNLRISSIPRLLRSTYPTVGRQRWRSRISAWPPS